MWKAARYTCAKRATFSLARHLAFFCGRRSEAVVIGTDMPTQASPKLKIRDEVAAFKRESTIGVACDLFYEKGYENATLDDVADRLSVTKPFIYANFGSKNELLAEICRRGVLAAKLSLDEVVDFQLGPRDTLRLFLHRYVKSILKHQKNIAVYTREEKNLAPEDSRALAELRKGFVAQLTDVLAEGAKRGEFKIVDPGMTALAIVGSVSWSTFWYHPGGRLEIDDIGKSMTELLMGMAGAQQD